MKKTFLAILFLIIAVSLGGWLAIRNFEHQNLYHPDTTVSANPSTHKLRYQEVQFSTPDGANLTGWWIPVNHPRGTILFCHGNSGNIGTIVHLAPAFFKRNFNLLLWDYRGYGTSTGTPSEHGLYTDARAAYDAAKSMSGKLPIIAYGHSLGGAVAIQLAHDRPLAALIIDSAFISAADMARRLYPTLPLDRLLTVSYDSGAKAASLTNLPKLFGHAIADEVIPFQSGRMLHAASASPKQFVLLEGNHCAHSWLTPGAPGNPQLEKFLAPFTR